MAVFAEILMEDSREATGFGTRNGFWTHVGIGVRAHVLRELGCGIS
jgi:hypothetical protein